jgi:Domain of unknown function DUF11
MGITFRALGRHALIAAALSTSLAAALSVAPPASAATPLDLPSGCAAAPAVPVLPATVPGTIVRTFPTTPGTTKTIVTDAVANDDPALKDGQGFAFTIDAPGLKVWDIDVQVQVDHDNAVDVPADLIGISLHAPAVIGGPFDGAAAALSNGGLGDAAAAASNTFFTNVTFDDQAATLAGLDSPVSDVIGGAPTGDVVPEEALGGFRGLDANGVWGLQFKNNGNAPYTVTGVTFTIRTYAGAPQSPAGTFSMNTPEGAAQGAAITQVLDLTSEDSAVISDVNLVTDIVTDVLEGPGALDITLQNSKRRATISTNNGDGGTNFPANAFDGTLWDDFLAPPVAGGGVIDPPEIGVVGHAFGPGGTATVSPIPHLVPEGAMSAFIGDDVKDTWTLTVNNVAGNGPAGTDATLNGWSLDFQTALCAPDIAVSSSFSEAPEVAINKPNVENPPVTQNVVITNPTTSGASGVGAKVTVGAGLSVAQAPPYCGIAGQIVTCAIGNVPAGGTKPFTIKLRPDKPDITSPVALSSLVQVSAAEASDTTNNNEATASISVRPQTADVSVTASSSPASSPLGGEVTYTANVQNTGPDASSSTKLDMQVPTGASLVQIPANCLSTSGVVTCDLNTLANGGSRSLQFRMTPGTAGTMQAPFKVRYAAGQADPDMANNAFTASTTITDTSTVLPQSVTTTTIINNIPTPASIPTPAAAKPWPSQIRFKLSKAGRVRITILSSGGRQVVGRILVHGTKGQNVVVLPSRLKKYLGPKKPVVRVVKRGAGFGLIGSPDRTLILVERLGK